MQTIQLMSIFIHLLIHVPLYFHLKVLNRLYVTSSAFVHVPIYLHTCLMVYLRSVNLFVPTYVINTFSGLGFVSAFIVVPL